MPLTVTPAVLRPERAPESHGGHASTQTAGPSPGGQDAAGPGWGLRVGIPSTIPSDADAAGPGATRRTLASCATAP